MSDEDEKLTKVGINWLVSIYPTLSKKIYKTRICQVYDLAFFNL